jgi:hypothetical protein
MYIFWILRQNVMKLQIWRYIVRVWSCTCLIFTLRNSFSSQFDYGSNSTFMQIVFFKCFNELLWNTRYIALVIWILSCISVQLTNSKEKNPSWEASSHSGSQENPPSPSIEPEGPIQRSQDKASKGPCVTFRKMLFVISPPNLQSLESFNRILWNLKSRMFLIRKLSCLSLIHFNLF